MMGRTRELRNLFLLLTLLAAFLLSACFSLPPPTQDSNTPTPLSTREKQIPCAAENWRIAITAVDQINLGDGTKLVFAKIGIENNDSLWGSLTGPEGSNENDEQDSIFLTTKDGSAYDYLDGSSSIPSGLISDLSQALYETTGQIETPLLPPGFVTLGKAINGEPHYYNFAFQIPESQIPNAITIGGMQVTCIQPHVIGENGIPIYREKTIQLPAQIYYLDTDIVEVRVAPSARRYPNLVGAELVTPDWKESIFITDVTRDRNEIIVTFDFTNFSSRAVSHSFNGYIMGDNRLFICQIDCEQQPAQEPVQPGQTAQNLTWTFTIPENETNLTFVYVYGGQVDLNEVRRINLE